MNIFVKTGQNQFAESILKGRMAESLVEEMLKKSGNKVYRFGYEAILQNLTQIQKSFDKNCVVGEKIKSIPDFIAIDINGKPIFLEVKFRWNGKANKKDEKRLKRIKDFWNAKIVFVNCFKKPFFRVSDPPYLDKKGQIVSRPLLEEVSWKIDKDIYNDFESLVEKYLCSPLLNN